MEIRGREVTVPVEDILNQYDWFEARWTASKLICRSPFRYDNSPSFFVRLTPENGFSEGIWSDSGGSGQYKSGQFSKLYGHLKGISEREAEDELLEIYGNEDIGYKENLTVNIPRLQLDIQYRKLRPQPFEQRMETYHPYIASRGITKEIAHELGIGYDEQRKAMVFLWKNGSDQIQNVKYRSVNDKIFWYEEDCKPISELIYNLSTIYKKKPKTVVIVESEIDAAYMSHICPCVALGGSNFSDAKADLLIKAPFENLVIATDNDKMGLKMQKLIIAKLKNHKNIYVLPLPKQYKDVNEVKELDELKGYLQKSKRIKTFLEKTV
jgi:5S rRNA maturation endonuclease (ribonuclease M5)